jgi:hypothetical protein
MRNSDAPKRLAGKPRLSCGKSHGELLLHEPPLHPLHRRHSGVWSSPDGKPRMLKTDLSTFAVAQALAVRLSAEHSVIERK